jgi:hypothetical protein
MSQLSDSATTLLAFIEAAKSQGASDEFILRLLGDRGWPHKRV